MVVAKLSDKILAQSIIVALMATSNNGSHSGKKNLISGLPKSLQSIAAAKQYGEVIEPVLYIPCLSFFSGSSLFD